ncbi:MAG: PmoA family protein [Fidelibacterota bacterium]|nr:MAG: PmoA family protein [Candidatus Neomarinimicrobiota bacterium]
MRLQCFKRAMVLGIAGSVLLFTALGLLSCSGRQNDQSQGPVTITALEGKLRVEVGGDLFTEYIYEGGFKPILYPVIGPHGIGMTRNFPMKDDVEGEGDDHPHQRSLWFTHGEVNEVNFWGESPGCGKTVQAELLQAEGGPDHGVIRTRNLWVGSDGKVQLSDTRTIGFRAVPGARIIDYQVTIHASEGDVTFSDTKEGTMGVRTHPNLRLENDPERGVTTANGQAVNSEGVEGRDVWGKRAKWVDYWGTIDGKTVGVAIFDHPGNPRHPTWWHARHYGLIAANPFGVHDFEDKPEGEGDLLIKAGDSVTFAYRFLFHEGDTGKAGIADQYERYAASTITTE